MDIIFLMKHFVVTKLNALVGLEVHLLHMINWKVGGSEQWKAKTILTSDPLRHLWGQLQDQFYQLCYSLVFQRIAYVMQISVLV